MPVDSEPPIVLPYASGSAAAHPHPIRWFLLSLGIYAATVYGSTLRWWSLVRPTGPHHYVVQAQAWLKGRLDLKPDLLLRDLSLVDGRLYSSFPPGPTLLLLGPVAIVGDRIPDRLLHCLLAALSVALMHQAMWLIARRAQVRTEDDRLTWLTAFYAMGTIIWVNVPYRGVWYTAHWFTLAALTASLCLASNRQRLAAGVAYAFAFASRPPAVGALPALLYLLWDDEPRSSGRGRRLLRLAPFFIGPAVMGVFLLWLNNAQFGSPFDFGRSRMLVSAQYADRLAKGVFSPVFLIDNIRAFFLDPPVWIDTPPYLISSHYGTGLFFTSPAFLCLIAAIRRDRLLGAFWLGVGLSLSPLLFYYGHESCRSGARYLLDFYPLLFILLLVGLRAPLRWWAKLLIGIDIAYTFVWVWYVNLKW